MKYQYLRRGEIKQCRTTMRFQSRNIRGIAIANASYSMFLTHLSNSEVFRLAGFKSMHSTGHTLTLNFKGSVIEIVTLIPVDNGIADKIARFFSEIHAMHLNRVGRY